MRGAGVGGVALSRGDYEGSFRSPSYMPPPAALGSTRESVIPPPPKRAERRAVTWPAGSHSMQHLYRMGYTDFALALVT